MQNVSARTAQTIRSIAQKGEEYIEQLILLGDKIANGLGSNSIIKQIEKKLAKPPEESITENSTIKIIKKGKHILTIRKDNNDLPSLHFPKNIHKQIESKGINWDDFATSIANYIDEKL